MGRAGAISAIVEATRSGVARFVGHVRDPMARSGYALILSSAMTSLLGFLFWAIAARSYDPATVGTATALIAAMAFLATVSTLGLRSVLVRYLPTAEQPAVLIRNSYLACSATAAAAAVVFLVGQPIWAAELGMLRTGWLNGVAFVLATTCWMIFVLQDNVLTGLHRAELVPAANAAYALMRIGVLLAATGAGVWGIFAAHTVPAAVTILVVNVLIWRKLAGRPIGQTATDTWRVGGFVRFAAGEHTASMVWLATSELLPLVVLATAGASDSAYYYLAFTIAYTFYLITANVGSAFVAEAARDHRRVEELARRALRHALLLVIPAVAVGLAVAPVVLGLLGPDYRREATDLLRLLMLSAIPQVVVGIAISTARVRRRISVVVAIYLSIAVLVFSGTALALRTGGLAEVGLVWLGTQTLLGAILLPTYLSFIWRRR